MSITEKLAKAVRDRVIISGQEIFVTMSIGISFFPRNGNNLADLLKNADMAMYQAKNDGGDQIVAFKPELNDKALNRFTLENDLQRASVNHDFFLQYQPFVDLSSGLIVGAEALIRWQHPNRGELPPQEFISMAERIGLIVPIGEWVIQTACMNLVRWQKSYKDNLRVAVNLSPRQLKDSRLPEFIWNTLHQNQLDPSFLELEITEEVFMSDPSTAVSVLHQLVEMGIRIAIDDFGTGYSSFSYLKNLPVTRLKIDRSFVRDIAATNNDSAIVKAIIAMARNLRLEITAEGVETADQVTFLQQNGPIESQGFYFGKPVGATEFQWLLNYTNSPHESYSNL
jgi:EAL domain-containing protein (putative c-di-GMP-specific phosphodiesterase class I)